MELPNVEIEGVVIKKLVKHTDERGWLIELYREDEPPTKHYRPAMSYVSKSYAGVRRGPHEHNKQSDFFMFYGPGDFMFYLWDNRPGNPNYQVRYKFVVGESNAVSILVPPNVVHGYEALGVAFSFNSPTDLHGGYHRLDPIDEIKHELNPNSPFKID